jgi:hypothetical protein
MAIFTFYFAICLLALIVRGYYRVPSSCIVYESIDKDDSIKKSKIAERFECQCHYTNFLWSKTLLNNDNQTVGNISMKNVFDTHEFEPIALVKTPNKKKILIHFSFSL